MPILSPLAPGEAEGAQKIVDRALRASLTIDPWKLIDVVVHVGLSDVLAFLIDFSLVRVKGNGRVPSFSLDSARVEFL